MLILIRLSSSLASNYLSRTTYIGCSSKFCPKTYFCTLTRKKQTFYEVLGIGKEATAQEIKSAYYTLSKQLHPDSMPKDKPFNESVLKFLQISEAYEILGSKENRAEYDKELMFSRDTMSTGGRSGEDISRDLHNYQEFRSHWRKAKPSQQRRYDSQFVFREYKFDQKDFDKFYELYKKRQKEDINENWDVQAAIEAERLHSSEVYAAARKQKYDEFHANYYRKNEHYTFIVVSTCLLISSGIVAFIWYEM